MIRPRAASGGGLITDGLVAYWPMDEGSGATITDIHGDSDLSAWSGYEWHASGDLVRTTDRYPWRSSSSALRITGELTQIARFEAPPTFADTGYNRGILGRWEGSSGNNRSYILYIEHDNSVAFSISHNGTFAASVTVSGSTLTALDFYTVAAVYDPSASMRIYIDGTLTSEQTSGVPSSIFAGTYDFWAGQNYSPNEITKYINWYDWARVYNRALSASEIASIAAGNG